MILKKLLLVGISLTLFVSCETIIKPFSDTSLVSKYDRTGYIALGYKNLTHEDYAIKIYDYKKKETLKYLLDFQNYKINEKIILRIVPLKAGIYYLDSLDAYSRHDLIGSHLIDKDIYIENGKITYLGNIQIKDTSLIGELFYLDKDITLTDNSKNDLAEFNDEIDVSKQLIRLSK